MELRCLFLIVLSIQSALAQDVFSDAADDFTPLLADVASPPFAVETTRGLYLTYELRLANWDSHAIRIEGVEAWDEKRLVNLEGGDLEEATVSAAPEAKQNPLVIREGGFTVILMLFPVDESPSSLHHRISLRRVDEPRSRVLQCARTVVRTDVVRIQPPVRGGLWLAVNGLANANHHRRSLAAWQGRLAVAQRYAIDFVKINTNGKLHGGDGKTNADHFCYGAEALAVADARVVSVHDGILEGAPHPDERAVEMTIDTVAGNTVALDLGDGRYAFYGHLQPGSIRVETGERVKGGQVLGLIGNSGNSSAPHLHFQVNSDPQMFRSEGQPYLFGSFAIVDRDGVHKHRDKMPMANEVLLFE